MDYEYNNDSPQDSTNHFHGNEMDRWEFPQPVPPKKERKGWGAGKVIALCLTTSILSGLMGAGLAIAYHIFTADDTAVVVTDQENTSILEGLRDDVVIDISQIDTSKLMTPAEVYAANVNSTVGITTSVATNYWGYQTTSAASGSGFILSDDGYILTNYHVIEGSSAITVTCYNGDAYEATLVGYDESNDIAVLKIDAQELAPVILGKSGKMNVGDSVLAIGNPLGELTFSLTTGTVSALERQVTMSNGVTMELIQTDCAINSGNSGGALFNLYGEVVGITNAKYSSSSSGASIDNIGFAIPIDDVRSIVESIIEKGYISKPYIGVSVTDVSKETQMYGLPAGAAVQNVTEGSPAANAGLQAGDIITEVDGQVVSGANALVEIIGSSHVGKVLNLRVYRQGSYLQISVTVGEQIQSAMKDSGYQNDSQPQTWSPYDFWGR